MRVLSLFDGMSCGQIALTRAGIKVSKYFASEVDKYAIQVTQKNFPNTIQLGDVQNVCSLDTGEIDLLIGGSPCQGFSSAGKGLNFDDPRSKLFFEYIRLLRELRPTYFLLENVKMKNEWVDLITEHVGVIPTLINSSLVSAQNRRRYYWTNIKYEPLKDRGVLLKDILESKNLIMGARIVGRKLDTNGVRKDYDNSIKSVQRIEINENPFKTNTITTVQKDNALIEPFKYITEKHLLRLENSTDVEKGFSAINPKKALCMTARQFSNWKGTYIKNRKGIRYLTPVECERLQTVPDNYTEGVSDSQRYKMLGNGWTVDVIAHIFKGIKK